MWYFAAAVAGLAAAGAIAGMVRGKSPGVASFPVSADSIKKLSVREISMMLARLENEEPPEVVHGAMCYRVAGPPSIAEYTCPVCGEKTIYDDSNTGFIENRLGTARRLAESIEANTEFQVMLDESRYCAFCSGDSAENPSLVLRVVREDGEEISNPVSLTQLRMLDSFLKGNLYWLTETDGQMPLKDSADSMRRLLGITEE